MKNKSLLESLESIKNHTLTLNRAEALREINRLMVCISVQADEDANEFPEILPAFSEIPAFLGEQAF